MSDAIETIEHKGHTIKIFYDENGFSPRDNDNMCIIHIGHSRYSFGDENHSDIESVQAAIRKAKAIGDVVLPLYMYDHSGITIALSPFSCPWDSGQCGFVQVKRSEIIANWGKKNFSPRLKAKALEVAAMEVKELDSFLRNEVYRFDIDNGEETCGNYIGDIKYCIEDAKGSVDCTIKFKAEEKEKAQLKLFPEGEKKKPIEV